MYSQGKADRHFSFLPSPGGIVIGYILLTLFAVVAGAIAFPFSNIWMGILYVLLELYVLVAIAVISATFLRLTLAIYAAFMRLGRRLLFGVDHRSESQRTRKSSLLRKELKLREPTSISGTGGSTGFGEQTEALAFDAGEPTYLDAGSLRSTSFIDSAACLDCLFLGRTAFHPGEIDMPQPPNPQIVKKVKKLSEIAEELRQGKHFPVTRLTTIKSLCGEPEAAAAFALFLAQRIQKQDASKSRAQNAIGNSWIEPSRS